MENENKANNGSDDDFENTIMTLRATPQFESYKSPPGICLRRVNRVKTKRLRHTFRHRKILCNVQLRVKSVVLLLDQVVKIQFEREMKFACKCNLANLKSQNIERSSITPSPIFQI